jgi:hypothetical protein
MCCAVLKSVIFVLDDDDDAVAPNSSQFPLVMPQKDNEDLDDWLDSVLDCMKTATK